MAAHEAPAAVHDHIAADDIRQRAVALVARYELDCDHAVEMDRADWVEWEGRAYSVLRELVRG